MKWLIVIILLKLNQQILYFYIYVIIDYDVTDSDVLYLRYQIGFDTGLRDGLSKLRPVSTLIFSVAKNAARHGIARK